MTLVGSGMGLASPASGLRFSATRGRIQGGFQNGVNYPSPFFDIGHTYLPTTIKQMFRWCRYYFLTNPLINATVFKLSEYPITDLLIEHKDDEIKKLWTEYMQDHLRYRAFQVEVGLDYHCYGNALIGISFPFIKFLTCDHCGFREQARRIRHKWVFNNYQFRLTCPNCGNTGPAKVKDFYVKNPSGIKLLRWNPEDVDVEYNPISGEYTHYYSIPAPTKNDIVIGKKDVVEDIPQIFIEALRRKKSIIFTQDMLFHMKRASIATQDRGWGVPLLLPVLKDAFYLQLMKKAQECVAPDTLIETSAGLVPAEAVRVGDMVRTHTGVYQPVTERRVRPIVEERGDYAVRITNTGMRQLPSTFSNNHPMWVLRRNDVNRRKDSKEHRRSSHVLRNTSLYEFQWVDAGDVQVGDYIGYPTNRIKEVQTVDVAKYTKFVATDGYVYSGVSKQTAEAFEKLELGDVVRHDNAGRVAKRLVSREATPNRSVRHLELDEDLAYIAGWYLGDGSTGARRVDFSMGPEDDGVELQSAIERVFGATFSDYPSKKSEGWTLCAFDTILSEFLSGWIPGRAPEKMIPKEILSSPDSVVSAFLLGYLEADGHSSLSIRNKEEVSVCCSNKQLTYQLWSLVLTLGCISTVSERTSYDTDITKSDGSMQHLEGGRPTFYWTVKSKSARRLSQHLLGQAPEVVESGKSGFFVHGCFASRVQKTEVVDCPEVVSFEVQGDHTFCTPGMATHNSILLEHIVPLRILFPSSNGTADVYTTVNLDQWRDHVAQEIARWRYDQNYIPLMPLPIGQETIGGDGRALLLTQEMQLHNETLLNGMQVPREFIMGGLSYAGTNVSLRMMENSFLGYILYHKHMTRFVMQQIAAFLEWPLPAHRFKPFKMADDLQRLALYFQLNQAQKLSDQTMLSQCDLDQKAEDTLMQEEMNSRLVTTEAQQLAMAEIQGKSQMIMTKYQIKAQMVAQEESMQPQAPGEPGEGQPGPGDIAMQQQQQMMQQQQQVQMDMAGQNMAQQQQMARDIAMQQDQQQQGAMGQSPLNAGQNMGAQPGGLQMDMQAWAFQQAQMLAQMDPQQQQMALQNIQGQSPELAELVLQMLNQMQPQVGAEDSGVDMRPLPEMLPPRRQSA